MTEKDGIKTYRILNLGAGVQSTALALMIEHGLIENVDIAIFADTGWEPPSVYSHVEWLKETITRFPVSIVQNANLRDDAMIAQVAGKRTAGHRFGSMPLHTRNPKTGKLGMIRRQCTTEYKIQPIEKYIKRELLGLEKGQRFPKDIRIVSLIGISADEASRMKPSPNKWQTMIYPLCDTPMGSGQIMTRAQCLAWISERYDNLRPAKSACIGCPYHSDSEWRDMKLNRPDEFADAVDFDKKIRRPAGMDSEAFLHKTCKPLDEVDFESLEDKGQMTFFDEQGNICDGGTCFL